MSTAPVRSGAAGASDFMARFSEALERQLVLSGWYEGRSTRDELDQIDFEPHQACEAFLREFGGLAIASTLFCDAYYFKEFYEFKWRVDAVGLPNCLPVAASWYWCEAELWIDELGRLYHVGDYEMVRVGDTVEQGLELVVLRKPFPENLERWDIESIPAEAYGGHQSQALPQSEYVKRRRGTMDDLIWLAFCLLEMLFYLLMLFSYLCCWVGIAILRPFLRGKIDVQEFNRLPKSWRLREAVRARRKAKGGDDAKAKEVPVPYPDPKADDGSRPEPSLEDKTFPPALRVGAFFVGLPFVCLGCWLVWRLILQILIWAA